MTYLRTAVLFGTLVVFLYLVNSNIITSENNLEDGTVAYFELAPVDPRSLIQGDYMTLVYDIEQQARAINPEIRESGQVVLSLDERNVARFERRYQAEEPLADNEVVVNFYVRNGQVRIGVDSFLFQEGQAGAYQEARFAEVRIIDGGGVMLVDMADASLNSINPSDSNQ
ncbi:MAG: GDYXXLXY domain-containing protein [Anaerolineae bacterium]